MPIGSSAANHLLHFAFSAAASRGETRGHDAPPKRHEPLLKVLKANSGRAGKYLWLACVGCNALWYCMSLSQTPSNRVFHPNETKNAAMAGIALGRGLDRELGNYHFFSQEEESSFSEEKEAKRL
jgi:hypothetical protein